MAEIVMRLLAITLALRAAAAQPLADPTLPPNAIADGKAVAATPAPLRETLQFTRRGPDDAFGALLAGRWVRGGDTIVIEGVEYRVERVTATSVVLGKGHERRVIDMAPQAEAAVQPSRASRRRTP